MEENHEKNQDRILIKGLLLRCIIGVNEFERHEKQDVVINVTLYSDFTEAVETDNLKKTVDYKQITKDIAKMVENSEYYLIETLAEKVADICLKHERVGKVNVAVEKPGALRFAQSVGVEIIRVKGRNKT